MNEPIRDFFTRFCYANPWYMNHVRNQLTDAIVECIRERRMCSFINHPLVPKGELWEVCGKKMRGA